MNSPHPPGITSAGNNYSPRTSALTLTCPHVILHVILHQVLNWSFLALRGDFNMNLAMHEEPQQLRIRTELLQGSMMRRFSSSVGVTRTGPGACRLTMDLYMQPAVPVPFGIRAMVGHQVRGREVQRQGCYMGEGSAAVMGQQRCTTGLGPGRGAHAKLLSLFCPRNRFSVFKLAGD